MRFDVVVGNPPYQENREGGKDLPIYPYFYELAKNIANKYILISPARFLFGAGATNKGWNNKMLNDNSLKVVYFNQKSAEVFQNTDIKGGIAVIYRDVDKKFGAIKTFTRFEELNNVLKKIELCDSKNIGDLVYGVTSYTFTEKTYKDYPELPNRVGKGSGNQLISRIFDAAPEIFFDKKQNNNQIKVYGRQSNNRVYKWTNLSYLKVPDNHNSFKVFIPAANGSGVMGEVLSTPVIGEPMCGHTATFISMGNFMTELEASSLLKYLKTKLCRAMLGIKKTTQHNKTKSVWAKVPLQDFSSKSDIDWSKPIPEIDKQLYKKYGLNQTEIDFIENKVKPMN